MSGVLHIVAAAVALLCAAKVVVVMSARALLAWDRRRSGSDSVVEPPGRVRVAVGSAKDAFLARLDVSAAMEADETGLRWERRLFDEAARARGITRAAESQTCFFQYFCPACGGQLDPGPGGAGTNQVCEACRVNYGCLPGAPDR